MARLIAESLTKSDTAGTVGLSPKTVGTHAEHILAKLDVARRTEVAAWIGSRPVLHSRPHGGDREE